MPSRQARPLDLDAVYPCPCRRGGQLRRIALTEALGCDRCQQIFTPVAGRPAIEQPSSYPARRVWRWRGTPGARFWGWPLIAAIALVLLAVWIPLALRSPAGWWALAALASALLLAIAMGWAYRP